MRRNTKTFLKFGALCVVFVFATIVMYRTFEIISEKIVPSNFLEDDLFVKSDRIEMIYDQPPARSFFDRDPKYRNFIKIDWHDYRFIEMEQNRQGIGERGVPEKIDESEKDEMDKLFRKNGFNALLSDRISVNRSVPDIRHKECKNKRYFAELPRVSIVVPFYNEYWSTLLRTVYSVLNRSPEKLIADIILVDDHSTREYLKEKLDRFIASYLPKVKVVRLPKREGLIAARVAGARIATGDVLVFLDSHVEANANWLPPLLEPIAANYRYCICPLIDVIQHTSFEYRTQDEGARGGFDWFFLYKRLALLPESKNNPTEIFESPVMAGGLFAISAKFFWELGGYDEGLDIWGGEQYELSFKIWQCGGKMYDAPCSRVGHIYRGPRDSEKAREGDFVSKNFKRVAEVWMDEYKQYLYDRQPDRYNNLDPGDLTKQKEIREKLQCKPFKWFMENVAFDLVKKFPPFEPPDYASGTIQSVAFPKLCTDTLGHNLREEIGLYTCAPNKMHPQQTQYFSLSWAKDIRRKFGNICWDVSESVKNSRVLLFNCHGSQGNQLWRYDSDKQWIVHGAQRNRCLEAEGNTLKVFVNPCNESNVNMKWEWGVVNGTALANYDKDH